MSVLAAVINKYEALNDALFPGGKPPLYVGEAPIASAGTPVRPPYVVLIDDGQQPEPLTDASAIEVCRIRAEVYATALSTVDQIVMAIRHGGSSPAARQGIDHGALDLAAPYRWLDTIRRSERREYAGWDYQAQRVHRCILQWDVMVELEV
jgi:hypothetical protein